MTVARERDFRERTKKRRCLLLRGQPVALHDTVSRAVILALGHPLDLLGSFQKCRCLDCTPSAPPPLPLKIRLNDLG